MPQVSIGLPVYNGENFLKEALDSILSQTYEDFELIISDNASTDGTADICGDYADRDARIRYIRQEKNIGAAPNFNSLFQVATGEYFKWAAHDDLIAPAYLEQCVKVLNSDHSVVLCTSKAQVIDRNNVICEAYDSDFNYNLEMPQERFGQLIQFHQNRCYEIFGVIRCSALRNTALIGSYTNGDGILLAHLGLRGRFVELPEYLFYPRRHPDQSQRIIHDKKLYDEWFDPLNRNNTNFPYWRIICEYANIVNKEPLLKSTKFACYFHIIRQALIVWRQLCGDVKRGIFRN